MQGWMSGAVVFCLARSVVALETEVLEQEALQDIQMRLHDPVLQYVEQSRLLKEKQEQRTLMEYSQ